jgi:NAD kinase
VGLLPRVVVVTRPSEYTHVVERHGTRQQARFFLESRGRSLDEVQSRHDRVERAVSEVQRAIPLEWRRTRVGRGDLARFLFTPDDTVVVVGQDGLVANVAKYLDGQPVLGVNPVPGFFAGVLVPHSPADVRALLRATVHKEATLQARTMVRVQLDDGQHIVALNELFLGHTTHQSARYRIAWDGAEERHSSSGLIVATGTGATGWAKSICRQRAGAPEMPAPTDPWLTFLVREAWPSVSTGAELTQGRVSAGHPLQVTSELDEGGVIFGDGIEADRLEFSWGRTAQIGVADRRLQLVTA